MQKQIKKQVEPIIFHFDLSNNKEDVILFIRLSKEMYEHFETAKELINWYWDQMPKRILPLKWESEGDRMATDCKAHYFFYSVPIKQFLAKTKGFKPKKRYGDYLFP